MSKKIVIVIFGEIKKKTYTFQRRKREILNSNFNRKQSFNFYFLSVWRCELKNKCWSLAKHSLMRERIILSHHLNKKIFPFNGIIAKGTPQIFIAVQLLERIVFSVRARRGTRDCREMLSRPSWSAAMEAVPSTNRNVRWDSSTWLEFSREPWKIVAKFTVWFSGNKQSNCAAIEKLRPRVQT